MRALVFRHVPFEDVGLIGPALRGCGFDLDFVETSTNPGSWPDWRRADALVIMGGPMSANDDLPFIRRELAVLEAALAAAQPVLGVCLGSQLMARALGARVYRNPVKEIGWAPVHWTGAGRADPLFRGLRSPEMLFHWHGETYDLPAGADWLAWSDACRHQAFRYGPSAYGLQFHLEVTPEMIADWRAQPVNEGDAGEFVESADPVRDTARLSEVASIVFARWAGLAAGRADSAGV